MNTNRNIKNKRYLGNSSDSILPIEKNHSIENKREFSNNCPYIHKRGLSMNNRIRTNYLNLNENISHKNEAESNRELLNNETR
jgi:hypothetical protein